MQKYEYRNIDATMCFKGAVIAEFMIVYFAGQLRSVCVTITIVNVKRYGELGILRHVYAEGVMLRSSFIILSIRIVV